MEASPIFRNILDVANIISSAEISGEASKSWVMDCYQRGRLERGVVLRKLVIPEIAFTGSLYHARGIRAYEFRSKPEEANRIEIGFREQRYSDGKSYVTIRKLMEFYLVHKDGGKCYEKVCLKSRKLRFDRGDPKSLEKVLKGLQLHLLLQAI